MQKKVRFQAYFLDLDGTARDAKNDPTSWNGFSASNKQAIRTASKTTPVVISTGRDPTFTFKLMLGLKVKYAICQNGACIINQKGDVLREKFISPQVGFALVQYAYKNKISVKINDDHVFYGANWVIRKSAQLLGEKAVKSKEKTPRTKYFKISFFGKRRKKIQKLMNTLKKMNFPIAVVSSVKGYVIEITHSSATKGLAALWVLKKLGIPPKQAAHIGDTMNDVPAFKKLGAGIAMGNATPSVKAWADYVAPHYKKGGLASVFNGELTKNHNRLY